MTKRKSKITLDVHYSWITGEYVAQQYHYGSERYEIEDHKDIEEALMWAIEAFYDEFDSTYKISTVGSNNLLQWAPHFKGYGWDKLQKYYEKMKEAAG